ncbi:hypothetical protein CB1_000325005 [Camelus ferus]|nr:hypothetical protein CB1_000325005 [Camelus ferus]
MSWGPLIRSEVRSSWIIKNTSGLSRPGSCAPLGFGRLPLHFWEPAGPPPGAEPGLGSGYLVLIAVAVLAAVAGAAALLITRYQRVTGKYSFRTQADNFSYQVFRE